MQRTINRFVFLSLLLTSIAGCATANSIGSVTPPEELPELPTHLVRCFQKLTPLPKGDWTVEKMYQVINTLSQSEYEKAQCGMEFASFYYDLKMKLAGKPKGWWR